MNKNRNKRVLSALTAATVLASTFAVTGVVSAEAASSSNTFSLYVPTTAQGDSAYKALANAFMAKYPKYTVKVTEVADNAYSSGLQTALQAGNAADVFRTEPGRGNTMSLLPLAKKGFLLPLNNTKASTVNPGSVTSQVNVGKNVYGVSLDLTAGGLVANATLMAADGVSWPKDFDSLLEACQAARKVGKSFFSVAGSVGRNAGIMAMGLLGSSVYAKDPTWNVKRGDNKVTFAGSAGWRQALGLVYQMNAAGCFQDGVAGADEASAIETTFFSKKAYAVFVPGSVASIFKAYVPPFKTDDIVIEAFPGLTAAETYMPVSVNYALSVNAKTKAKAATKAFIDFTASPAGQAAYQKVSKGLPTTGKITDANVPDPQAYREVMKFLSAKKTYAFPDKGFSNGQVYVALGAGIQGILTGQATVGQVLKSLDTAWASQ